MQTNMYECDYCMFFCRSYRWMIHHLRIHCTVNNFKVQCGHPTCIKTFTNLKSLQQHLRTKHVDFYQRREENNHDEQDLPENEEIQEELNMDQAIPRVPGDDDNWQENPDFGAEVPQTRRKIGKILLELRENHNLTSKAISSIADKMCDILAMSITEMRSKVCRFYSDRELQQPEGLLDLLQQESDTSTHCRSLNSQYKLEEFAKSELHYVPPVEYVLGMDDSGKPETVQHIPLSDTLEWFLAYDDVFDDIQTDHESMDGSLHDVFDGSHYKNHNLLNQPNTLGIVIFTWMSLHLQIHFELNQNIKR